MGSSHFGDMGMGSSSRKGKKSGSEKPKQPQRGLGVAKLEKIRLHSQMAAAYLPSLHHHPPLHTKENVMEFGFASSPSSSTYTATSSPLFAVHPTTMMGFGEANQRIDIRYVDQFWPSSLASTSYFNHNGDFLQQCSAQQPVTLPLLQQTMEDSTQKKRSQDCCHLKSSMSQNSDSSDTQEIDLELRLSSLNR